MIKNNIVMFKGSFTNFRHTGCLWGSSKFLAKSLTKPLTQISGDRPAMRILEAGSGAGAITVEIIKHLKPGDQLVLCEVNPEFMTALKKRLSNNEDYLAHQEQISFFTGYVQELPDENKFDLIICSLPFLNFDIETVRSIFNKFIQISTQKGLLTYFEYMGIRPISCVLSPSERRERIKLIDNFFYKEAKARHIKCEPCWLNLLPTNVYTLNIAA